jgi:hypothetical protein
MTMNIHECFLDNPIGGDLGRGSQRWQITCDLHPHLKA